MPGPSARSGARTSLSILTDIAAGALDESYAAAAARRGRSSGSRGRAYLLAAGLLAAGLLLAVAASQAQRAAPVERRQRALLAGQVSDHIREVRGLEAAAGRLRAQLGVARSDATSTSRRARSVGSALAVLGPLTGAVAVAGPGVVVRLDDPPSGPRLTDTDLQQVTNALWAAGAEALSVDDVRLTARSAIRTAGEAILVGLQPLRPPYAVAAVGDRDRLAAGFADSAVAARLRSAAATYGGHFSVRTGSRLRLPAARLAGPGTTQ